MKAFNTISRIFDKINSVLSYISAAAIFIMGAICFISVIFRYFLRMPITGANELVQIGLLVFVYAGLCAGLRKNKAISVPIITEKLSHAGSNIMIALGDLLCAVISAIIAVVLAGTLPAKFGNMLRYSTDIYSVPLAWIYLFVVICYILMTLNLLLRMVELFLEIKHPPTRDVRDVEEPSQEEVL